jgi:hypothetical protein
VLTLPPSVKDLGQIGSPNERASLRLPSISRGHIARVFILRPAPDSILKTPQSTFFARTQATDGLEAKHVEIDSGRLALMPQEASRARGREAPTKRLRLASRMGERRQRPGKKNHR